MFNIQIIAVGKLKESYWQEAEAEYRKRLKPYAKLTITELSEESFRESDDREKIKKLEAEKILKSVSVDAMLIACHEKGKELTSVDLAKFLQEKSIYGDELTFVIGGPLGLDQTILEKADHTLSLSALTFPHQMVRTILLEQLYRAGTILVGKTYHY